MGVAVVGRMFVADAMLRFHLGAAMFVRAGGRRRPGVLKLQVLPLCQRTQTVWSPRDGGRAGCLQARRWLTATRRRQSAASSRSGIYHFSSRIHIADKLGSGAFVKKIPHA
jgi:hypothetical protein